MDAVLDLLNIGEIIYSTCKYDVIVYIDKKICLVFFFFVAFFFHYSGSRALCTVCPSPFLLKSATALDNNKRGFMSLPAFFPWLG